MERFGGGADNYRERLAVNPGLAARLFSLAFVTREQRTGAATSYLSTAATGQLDRAVLEAVFPSTQELLDIGEPSNKSLFRIRMDPHWFGSPGSGSAYPQIRIDLSRLDPDPYCWMRIRLQKQGKWPKLSNKSDFQPFKMAWDLLSRIRVRIGSADPDSEARKSAKIKKNKPVFSLSK
jgi:hypothetical protein